MNVTINGKRHEIDADLAADDRHMAYAWIGGDAPRCPGCSEILTDEKGAAPIKTNAQKNTLEVECDFCGSILPVEG